MTKENDFDVIDEVFSQFKFNSHNLRTIMRLGEIWLVADDIWRALEYTNPRSVLSQLDDDQKSKAKIHTRGGPQSVCIINEPGLYNLMLRSRNSHARHFQKWITKWVLPALRENRQYETGKAEQF